RVSRSSSWGVGGAGWCPVVCGGVVLSAGGRIARGKPAPHDHLTARPKRPVKLSGRGCIENACSCPSIIARAFHIQCGRYRRKSVTTEPCSISFTRIPWLTDCPADITGSQRRVEQTLPK